MNTYFSGKTGFAISFFLGLMLAVAAICSIIILIWPGIDSRLISYLSDNWLIIIFKLHANVAGTGPDALRGTNIYDITILVLFILVCFSLYSAIKDKHRIWYMAAIILLILGIVLFLITHIAGRSTFMLSGLIVSVLLLTRGAKNRIAGVVGIIANALLLSGDFTVGINLKIIPVLFAFGYLLLIIWIFIIAKSLLRTET